MREAVPEGTPVPGEGARSSAAPQPREPPEPPPAALGSCSPHPSLHPCLSRTAGHSSSPIPQGVFFRSALLAPCYCSAALYDTMTYFIFFIFLPENSKALLQCGLQGGKANLRSAGRANQGPFQKFVAVCERLGKERRGQSRHSRVHSGKQGDDRKNKRSILYFEPEGQCLQYLYWKSEPTWLPESSDQWVQRQG